MLTQNRTESWDKQEGLELSSLNFALKYATLIETAGLLDTMNDNEATELKSLIENLIALKKKFTDPEDVAKAIQLLSIMTKLLVNDNGSEQKQRKDEIQTPSPGNMSGETNGHK